MVVTAVAPMAQDSAAINLFQLAMYNKEIKGTIFGSLNPRADIPALLGLYREGQLKLDELISARIRLTEVNVVTVSPTGRRPSAAVTTATPAGC